MVPRNLFPLWMTRNHDQMASLIVTDNHQSFFTFLLSYFLIQYYILHTTYYILPFSTITQHFGLVPNSAGVDALGL